MKTITVRVTKRDIQAADKAVKRYGTHRSCVCPIAQALHRVPGFSRARVRGRTVQGYRGNHLAWLPKKAQDFVWNYDTIESRARVEPQPFSFKLTLE